MNNFTSVILMQQKNDLKEVRQNAVSDYIS